MMFDLVSYKSEEVYMVLDLSTKDDSSSPSSARYGVWIKSALGCEKIMLPLLLL